MTDLATRSIRQYWRGMHGRTVLNFNWDAIDDDSTVEIAAAEWREDAQSVATSPRFVGDANITVRNIVPHGPPHDPNHGVTFVVTVDWPDPLNIVTDIVVLAAKPEVTQHPPLDWARLGFVMERQQQTNWCWCATTVSVANFYGGNLVQCGFAGTHLGRNDCCGAGAAGPCNVASDLVSCLSETNHLASWKAATPTFAELSAEIDGGRPTTLRIQWSGGGGHFMAVMGYLRGDSTWLAVDDPAYGPSDIRIDTMLTAYQGSGTIDETHFTHA